MSDDGCEIVRRYNEAWLARDVAAMGDFLGEDLVLWHNHIRREFGKSEMLGFVTDALDVLTRVEFRNARRTRAAASSSMTFIAKWPMGAWSMMPRR